MAYTLGEAAKATGISKASLSRAIGNGRISAIRNENGSFSIEPVELHRVYPPATAVTSPDRSSETIDNPPANPRNTNDVSLLQAHLDAALEQVDDLRRRLDRSDEERREAQARVIGLLSGPAPVETKKGFLGRLFGS